MTAERIQAKFTYPEKFLTVEGVKIHYIEVGEGAPILFLHGVPSSCYVWRNIIPHLSPLGRCIALDLVGFGKSDKLDSEYDIATHIKYLEAFIEKLGLRSLTIVMHGLGSVLGFNYAMKHESNCTGLAFYEAFLETGDKEDISLPYQEQITYSQNMLAHDARDNSNFKIVDVLLQQSMMRRLTDEELEYYRQPFLLSGSIKPVLSYLNQLPTDKTTTEMSKIISNYSKKLLKSKLPKLMMYTLPGFITTMATVMWAKENMPNIEIVDLGEELHFAQENNPDLMGESISIWFQATEQQGG